MTHGSDDIERFVRPSRTPPHLFRSGSTYFITAKTLHGEFFLASDGRRRELLDALRFACKQRDWTLIAWVALSNYYHCILQAPSESEADLSGLIGSVHRFTSRKWNTEEGQPGRQVWYRYWDTCLTSTGAFYARLNYIHHNPVKHGLVSDPAEYPHSSYHYWLESTDLDSLADSYPWDRLLLE